MLVIDITFFLLELGVGLIVGSLALMADAFHMVSTQMIIRPLAKLTISSWTILFLYSLDFGLFRLHKDLALTNIPLGWAR
jgi:hypothetical protein